MGLWPLSGERPNMENSHKANHHEVQDDTSLDLINEEPEPSVIEMSPPYPKYRDLLIKAIFILILIVVCAGAYLFIKGRDLSIPIPGFKQNPFHFFTDLFFGDGTYKACEAFMEENRDLFGDLGESIVLTPIRQEVRFVNRKKTARVIFRAKGSKGTGNLLFLLEKRKKGWEVVSVSSKIRGGGYQILYPRSKAKSENRV